MENTENVILRNCWWWLAEFDQFCGR